MPGEVAVTRYDPAIKLAVSTTDVVATPVTSVIAVVVFTPPVNVPVGPLVGAVNVTRAPFTGIPPEFLTSAEKCNPKGVLIAAL